MATPIDWHDAVTLEEHVIRLFQEGKMQTEEFKTLVRVFGKSKIESYLKSFKENGKNPPNSPSVSDKLCTARCRDD